VLTTPANHTPSGRLTTGRRTRCARKQLCTLNRIEPPRPKKTAASSSRNN
jgi:hypothetical protein